MSTNTKGSQSDSNPQSEFEAPLGDTGSYLVWVRNNPPTHHAYLCECGRKECYYIWGGSLAVRVGERYRSLTCSLQDKITVRGDVDTAFIGLCHLKGIEPRTATPPKAPTPPSPPKAQTDALAAQADGLAEAFPGNAEELRNTIARLRSSAPKAPKAQAPAPKTQAPAPKAQAPAPKAQAPAPKTQAPAPKTQAPAPKTQAPPKTQVPFLVDALGLQSEALNPNAKKLKTLKPPKAIKKPFPSRQARAEPQPPAPPVPLAPLKEGRPRLPGFSARPGEDSSASVGQTEQDIFFHAPEHVRQKLLAKKGKKK